MGWFGKRRSEKKQNTYQTPAGAANPTHKTYGSEDTKSKIGSKGNHGSAAVIASAAAASAAASSSASACSGGGGCC
ncbi:hypothetical protein P3X46_021651 [Hevea brasiliensis]|uniref:Uncharacterized protein n=1 Tax=Hevea brasiliensis TaxID=3981 RepID=A0ABQ9LI90_HEVBR|nr:hypothetical protein P3X46_021651 [Hevea brasiliensis]